MLKNCYKHFYFMHLVWLPALSSIAIDIDDDTNVEVDTRSVIEQECTADSAGNGKVTPELDPNPSGKSIASLHVAASKGALADARTLLIRGADPNEKSANNQSPTEIAYQQNDTAMLDLLRKFGGSLPKHVIKWPKMTEKLNAYLQSERHQNKVIYIYPLFLSDFEFFNHLREYSKYSQAVVGEILFELALEQFPNGPLSLAASKNLNTLLNEVEVSPKNRNRIWETASKNWYQSISISNVEINELNIVDRLRVLEQLPAKEIAHDITIIEERLFRAISIESLIMWLRNKDMATEVVAFTDFSNRMVNLFALYIASEPNHEKRQLKAKKVLKIGEAFLSLSNYPGIQQIVASLIMPEVKRLVTWNKDLERRCIKLQKIVSPNGKHKAYLKHHQKLPNRQPRIPLLAISLQNLNALFEVQPDTFNNKWLHQVINTFRDFNKARIQAEYNFIDSNTQAFFETTPQIDGDVLTAFSALQLDWPRQIDSITDRVLCIPQCDPMDLVRWTKAFGNIDIARKIFARGIWSGAALMRYLGGERKRHVSLLMALGLSEREASEFRLAIGLNSTCKV